MKDWSKVWKAVQANMPEGHELPPKEEDMDKEDNADKDDDADKEDDMPDMPKEVADMVKKAKDSVDAMFELAEVVQGVEKNSFKVNKRVSEMIDFLLNDLGMSMGV